MAHTHAKLVIIGSGPAGYTAAIYAARAMVEPLLISGFQPGGQLMITTDVENYPGFAEAIQGPWLMEQMRLQAEHVGTRIVSEYITKVDLKQRPFRLEADSGETYSCDALVIATGAQAKWLGIPSEAAFQGGGVSACATCDGFFFRGKEVVVVGGGNTAVEEALYLANIASKVTVVHRRDSFRAERILQERLFKHPNVEVLWHREIAEICGVQKPAPNVTHVRLKDPRSGEISEVKADGVFVAIGHQPATAIFEGQLPMRHGGYLTVKPGTTETEIPGVFAAGDVTDDVYRQAITAAGMGCMAALEAEKFLANLDIGESPVQAAAPSISTSSRCSRLRSTMHRVHRSADCAGMHGLHARAVPRAAIRARHRAVRPVICPPLRAHSTPGASRGRALVGVLALDWDKIRIFLNVAEAGSFTKAGDDIGLSQSAVSRQISALERELKAPLFHRHARGLLLTEQGDLLFRAARDMKLRLENTRARLVETSERPTGDLKVTTTVGLGTSWLSQRVGEFLDLYPDVRIELILTNEELDLAMREADVAIRMRRPAQPDLIQRRLFTVHYHAFASPDYVKRFGEPKTIEELDDHRLVSFGGNEPSYLLAAHWLADAGREGRERRQVHLTVNNIGALQRAMEAGAGIGILPDYAVDGGQQLVQVLRETEMPSLESYLVYAEEMRSVARVQAFRDFLVSKAQRWTY